MEKAVIQFPPFDPRYADDTLRKLHPCPVFDDHIRFDDSIQPDGKRAHDYYVDGEKWTYSVTTFIHDFFPKFNADIQIARMMSSPNWELKKYYGMTSDQIKKAWDENREDAGERGTRVHAAIEYYYNEDEVGKEAIRLDHPTPDYGYFLRFQREVACKWIPWRTELRVFDRELRIPGSVDMLYLSPRSTPQKPLLIMYDWKRSKNVLKEKAYGCGKPPVTRFPNHDLSHYQLQLNVYKALIERNTEYRIESMWLGVFHPNQEDYVTIPVPDLRRDVEAMFQVRLEKLQKERSIGSLPSLAKYFICVENRNRKVCT